MLALIWSRTPAFSSQRASTLHQNSVIIVAIGVHKAKWKVCAFLLNLVDTFAIGEDSGQPVTLVCQPPLKFTGDTSVIVLK